MKHSTSLLLLAVLASIFLANTSPTTSSNNPPSDQEKAQAWVDSIYNSMTFDQQLGQLFMIRAHSNKGPEHIAEVKRLIRNYHVGGLCFFQGTPEAQAKLTNEYQQLTRHAPLMVSMDAEWGLGMRMSKSTISFPRQLTLGAIQDNRLIYEMGEEIARQLKRLGVHVNFAPVADVNNNPSNPVINTRSFGEDRYNVSVKSYMYMNGMQDNGVMACAKHFPGHGDTDVDSHYDLPIITHGTKRLDSIELYPFRILAEQNIGSMMVAHLNVPTLDDRPNRPTTLSENTVTTLLKEDIGYDGLIFTDGLEMKGVTKHFEPGEVEAEAIRAGNDVLLLPEDIAAAVETIKEYIDDGKIPEIRIEESVKKVLLAKYNLELTRVEPIVLDRLRSELNSGGATALKQELYEHALTLVRNRNDLLPFRNLDSLKVASLSLGTEKKTPFQTRLDDYMPMIHLQTDKNITAAEKRQLIHKLNGIDVVLVSLHDLSMHASKQFGTTASERDFIKHLQSTGKQVVVINFGSPYALKYFDDAQWLINAYEEDKLAQDVAAQAIFGAVAMRGRLPVTASDKARFNTGVTANELFRLGYAAPERVGLNSDTLQQIEQIIQDAIATKATPGAVILVAKDGKIVYEQAFGHHTYGRQTTTNTSDIFDLASITKIAASTASVMKLYEEGKVNIHQPIGNFLATSRGTNKADLPLFDIMAHRAGLRSWIPFYQQTIDERSRGATQLVSEYYSRRQSDDFGAKVTDQLYLRKDFQDSIWAQIYTSELSPVRDYRYSDLGFYMVSELVKEQSGKSIDNYMHDNFYRPLGLQTMTYNPLLKHDAEKILPTEEDNYWRHQQVHGYVHDMGAAMLNGVSGHAGLFSDAKDLAIMMQLFLNMGYYGGTQYLHPATIRTFTTRHPDDKRRAIGFDMLQLDPEESQNMSPLASEQTFGHLGFTGTAAWADPENNLVFIFLSNRTYPSMNNRKLMEEDYRPRIQSVLYNALQEANTKR